jgi:hypothetical protein
MKNWIESLKEKSRDFEYVSEDLILSELPSELIEEWEKYMRGKTCPIIDTGIGIYSCDLRQFLLMHDPRIPKVIAPFLKDKFPTIVASEITKVA